MNHLKLDDLPAATRDYITERTLTTGQILFQQGETAETVYWVVSGRLKLISFNDQYVINHYFVRSGEWIGEIGLYAEVYPCTAIADTPTQIRGLPKPTFLEVLRTDATIAERYLSYLTWRFDTVKRLLELRSIRSARDRLLHYLSLQHSQGQDTIPLRQSLKNLALELGLSPEALSRTLAQLQVEGVISRKKRSISLSEEWRNS